MGRIRWSSQIPRRSELAEEAFHPYPVTIDFASMPRRGAGILGRMDVVEFRVRVEMLGVGNVNTVTPYVNGTSLIELARRVELGQATKQSEPDLAGAYAGLAIGMTQLVDWKPWYLNDEPQSWFGDGDSCLLGCTCGETGCWPLTAKVAVSHDRVTWSGFRTGHRAWDLRMLGPFTFHRDQYKAALTASW